MILKSAFDVNWLWNKNSTSPRRSKSSNARTFNSWALLVSSAWLHICIWRLETLLDFKKFGFSTWHQNLQRKKVETISQDFTEKLFLIFFCCQKIYISMPHDGKIFRLCFFFFPEMFEKIFYFAWIVNFRRVLVLLNGRFLNPMNISWLLKLSA